MKALRVDFLRLPVHYIGHVTLVLTTLKVVCTGQIRGKLLQLMPAAAELIMMVRDCEF
jgi:hypothetical protein